MKLKEVLDKTIQFFRDKKIESPRLEAELLLAHGLKLERIQLYLKFDQPLAEEELAHCRELVRRRVQGEPVSYILGYREFFGSSFKVTPAVLIPRPETEQLVEEALNWAQGQKEKTSPLGLLDLGTGSGCIGLTLLKKLPEAKLIAVDISQEALVVAQENAAQLGVGDRVQFVHADAATASDVLKAFKSFVGKSTVDIVVANPPYIASTDPSVEEGVVKFEPHQALFACDEGLALLKKWSQTYKNFLSDEGLMLMEMGYTQGEAMKKYFQGLEVFQEISVIKDLSGHDRIIRGVKKHG